ncbi:MAG: CHAD domain-containing protein [Rhodocyclaceae bacterium]|jgi:inorganic triphosphatase YgiF|nr:CHAD domain-containing protein [Rhodocyclaceae bacterium]
MAEEIELKLALPESAQRAFLRQPLLRQAVRKETHRLTNLYYDTPGLDLRQHGIALRLRAQGKFWLQTVKCAGDRAGGLSARPEWETPYGGHFDFSPIDDPEVRAWLERPKIATRLSPVFETNFQRMAWTFELPRATRVELALDRGWISAAGQREPVSEVELELIEGDAGELFALALALAARVPLVPAPLSKADRGYALFLQTPPAPVRAASPDLSAEMMPLAAFRAIALACLDQLQRNHRTALTSEDPEYIHQMRVALRRLRAALRLFRPLLPADFEERSLPLVRELMAPLGKARDVDVLLAEIANPVLAALPDEPRLAALIGVITERRHEARQQALHLLTTPRYGVIVLQLLALTHGLSAVEAKRAAVGTPDATGQASLPDFARKRLRRLRKKALALAREVDAARPETLHALRIAIKRLRYALEFFSPLAERKPTRRLLGHLAELQEVLGQINDLANAGALLMESAGNDQPLREAVSLIAGWHGPRYQRLLSAVPRAITRLGTMRLPHWRGRHPRVTSASYAGPQTNETE